MLCPLILTVNRCINGCLGVSGPLHSDREKGQHTVHVEGNSGSFAHRHRRVAGHTGEIRAAVFVDRYDVQVAPGRHPLPVW